MPGHGEEDPVRWERVKIVKTKNRTWRNHLRAIWRSHAKPWLRDYEWPIIGGLGLVAIGLGYIGFQRLFSHLGESRSTLDLFYLTLQLFVLDSGSVLGPKTWELEIARLLGPAVTGYTAVKALTVIFSQQLQMLSLLCMKDHTVICGLGRKGLVLAKGFHEYGERVVVIEQDDNNEFIQHCRDLGSIVLVGNATRPEMLRKAGVHKARYLISVCGDDGANTEIALHSCELVKDRKGKILSCYIHIVDPDLLVLLREKEIFTEGIPSFRLEFFNVYDNGARVLLKDFMDFIEKSRTEEQHPHLLLVGLGRMGRSLIVHAGRFWWNCHRSSGKRLRITILDKEADRKKESVCFTYPQLEKVCDLIPLQMDIHSPDFRKGKFLSASSGSCDLTAIFICFDNDSMGLSTALSLFQLVRKMNIPIVVRMTHEAGLATLLRGLDGNDSAFQNVRAFAILDKACDPEIVLGGTHEILARAIHQDYVEGLRQSGETPQTNPSMVPWDELPEMLKEANRRQADHISAKLKAVGCGIAPLTDWDAPSFKFSIEEVELMARMEHERWMEDLIEQGWTYAPGPKNKELKTNPALIPYDRLPEEEKEKDRRTVRNLPAFLAKVDLQIYRLAGNGDNIQ